MFATVWIITIVAAANAKSLIEKSYLNCPIDIIADLPPTKSSMTLGKLWKKPKTNIDASTIHLYPKTAGPHYNFEAGKHLISYTAKGVSCSFIVEIKDITPPQMINCPSDIVKVGNNPAEIITWVEPTFTDNVKIGKVIKPHRKSGSTWHSGESIRLQYVASDQAGNDRTCNFKVSYKSIVCPALISTSTISVTSYIPQSSYGVDCVDKNKAPFGNFGYQGTSAYCQGGDYFMESTNIGVTIPECVGFVKATANTVCKEGSQKFMYDDWMEAVYYCSQCPTGTYYNAKSKTCVGCKLGYYQDKQGRTSCKLCPLGSTTTEVGSKDIKQCYDFCKPGHYSVSGLNLPNQPCKMCLKGTYSGSNGSKECKSCAQTSTTFKSGATNPSDCYVAVSITHTNPFSETASYEDATIALECLFGGEPTPTATWSKINGALPKDSVTEDIYDLQMEVMGSTLTLQNVKVADSGIYKCNAYNNDGRDEGSIRVNVYQKYD